MSGRFATGLPPGASDLLQCCPRRWRRGVSSPTVLHRSLRSRSRLRCSLAVLCGHLARGSVLRPQRSGGCSMLRAARWCGRRALADKRADRTPQLGTPVPEALPTCQRLAVSRRNCAWMATWLGSRSSIAHGWPLGPGGKAVPGERIELPTNGLQNRCSTAELTRRFSFPVSDLDSISDREGTRSATGLRPGALLPMK